MYDAPLRTKATYYTVPIREDDTIEKHDNWEGDNECDELINALTRNAERHYGEAFRNL